MDPRSSCGAYQVGPLLAAPARQRGPGAAALRQRHGGNPRSSRGEGCRPRLYQPERTQVYADFLGSRGGDAAVYFLLAKPTAAFLKMWQFLN